MIYYGIISEVIGSNAKVDIGDLTTDFLPVIQLGSSFKHSWVPIREKEQCVVFSPSDEINSGFILRGLYYTEHPAPIDDRDKELTVFSDGTTISYDTKNKLLDINASLDITVKAKGKISIDCKEADVKCSDVNIVTDNAIVKAGNSVTVDSPLVELGGAGGTGVVTQECICSLTGLAHPEASTTVRAIKLR